MKKFFKKRALPKNGELHRRKLVDDEAVENHELYKLLSEKMTDVVWLMDFKGMCIYVSPSITQFTGFSEEDYLAQTIEDRFTQESAIIARKILEGSLSSDLLNSPDKLKAFSLTQQLEYKCKDGSTKWGELLITPYFGKMGQCEGIHGVTRDITQRRGSEENLKNSLALLESILQTTDNGILVVDLYGSIVKMNNRFVEMWQISDELIQEANDEKLLNFILNQLTDPNTLVEKVKYLYNHLAEESTDIINFKDGRVFERFSKAMIIGDEPIGRVWTFIDITERKKADELLQNERTLFRTIIDLIPDAIYVKDVDGKKILANPKEVLLAGMITEQETIGKADNAIYSQKIANHSQEEDQYILQTGTPIFEIESTLEDKNGDEHSLLGSKVPLRDMHGTVTGIVGINHEITERKRADELLRQSEERYRALVENVGEGIGFVDKNEVFEFANPVAEDIFGVERGGLIGRSIKEFVSNDQFTLIQKQTAAREQGERNSYEIEIIQRGGERRNILITAVPQFDQFGEFIGAYGVLRDFTTIVKAENEIRLLANAMKSISECVSITDMDDRIVFVNEAFLETYGYTIDELMGSKINVIRSLTNHEELTKQILPSTIQGKWEGELINRRKNGSEFTIHLSTSVIHDASGVPIALIGVSSDITERKKNEKIIQNQNQELIELNATKDKFFSIIAHDLKNPLSTLLAGTELLLKNFRNIQADKTETILKNLNSNTQQTFKLLENLLDWARNQQNRMEFNPELIDIGEVANQIVALIKPTAASKNITLLQKIISPTVVIADAYMVNAILRNLISNAIKFTRPEGVINVRATELDGAAQVSVSDNGVGIKPEEVEKLFRIDTNASKLGTAGEKGTGLGLLLCKEFVDKHGGNIRVESKVDKGSTFTFTLPIGS
ncbi:MAG TPA: PAS domain S-box protein [Williamwhitmania sp.]|nr:PAS domain S-box protein [Williamwhitmania sp.]